MSGKDLTLDEVKKSIEKIQRNLAVLEKRTIIDVDGFQNALNKAIEDAVDKFTKETNQDIVTQTPDGKVYYKTTISLLGSITNVCEPPNPNDPLWAWHQTMFNDAWQLRQNLITKLVEIIENAVTALIPKIP